MNHVIRCTFHHTGNGARSQRLPDPSMEYQHETTGSFRLLLAVAPAPRPPDGPYQLGTFQNGSTVRLAADRSEHRSTPSLSGPVIATLPIGSRLRITSKSDVSSTINRLNAPWYGVSFGDRGVEKKGLSEEELISIRPWI